MKTSKVLLKSIFILSIFCMLILTGCSKEECYSCDSDIDAWVKENAKELLAMNREQLSELSISKQKASLRMFSPERRRNIWIDKFNQVMSLTMTDEEKEYLKILEKTLLKIDFSKELPIELENYLLKWTIEVKDRFDWPNTFITNAFFRIGDVNSIREIQIQTKNNEEPGGGDNDCACRYNIGCGLQNYNCEKGDCDETDTGCGFFGGSSCTGKCN